MPSEPAPAEGNPTPGYPPRAAQDDGCFRRRLALLCSVGSRLFLSTDGREASDLTALAALCSRSGEEMSAGGLRDDSTEPRSGDRRPPLTLRRLSGGPATLRGRFSHAEVATLPGDAPRWARATFLTCRWITNHPQTRGFPPSCSAPYHSTGQVSVPRRVGWGGPTGAGGPTVASLTCPGAWCWRSAGCLSFPPHGPPPAAQPGLVDAAAGFQEQQGNDGELFGETPVSSAPHGAGAARHSGSVTCSPGCGWGSERKRKEGCPEVLS
ncbi:uncharacterized protein LOC122467599 [Prionailurus bengalensis]|uniref:uncharacterized protein LOC122467599 n=1 Tax=Prionailurus bengalensis TaxID=37029 RepID=UPI001CA8A76A|nr:uncharacterized protein LOC122467599 [Prionailurus bengalensis]